MVLFYKEYLVYFEYFFIFAVVVGIGGVLYYKNFRSINRKLCSLIFYGSYFSLLFWGIVWLVFFFMPRDFGEGLFLDNYSYLMSPKSYSFRSRVLDDKDIMPLIKDVESIEEIDDILKNTELMEEMLRGLIQNKLPCVFSYNIKDEDDVEDIMPNFMILNKQFDVVNNIGKNIEYFTNILGIRKSMFSRFLKNSYGKNSLQGPFYFIFNANVTGISLDDGKEVWRHSTLFKWDKDPEFLKFRQIIQIECVAVFLYDNRRIIKPAILTFEGRLAFCIQDYLIGIEDHRFTPIIITEDEIEENTIVTLNN